MDSLIKRLRGGACRTFSLKIPQPMLETAQSYFTIEAVWTLVVGHVAQKISSTTANCNSWRTFIDDLAKELK